MEHVLASLRRELSDSNWYGAVSTALTLPDLAAWADGQPQGKKRYIDWFNAYVRARYTMPPMHGHPETILLGGADAYALRCAWLHSGNDELTEHKVREALDRFIIVAPIPGREGGHRARVGRSLVVRADLFCEDIRDGVAVWMAARGADVEVERRLAQMARIREFPIDVDGVRLSV